MRPPLGLRRPTKAFKVVVFPAPFAPISVTSSPLRTSRSMPLTALIPPYDTVRPLTSSKGASQVGGDDGGVAPYLCRGALGDLSPVVEDGDAVAQAHDEPHIVLDQEERGAIGADSLEQASQFRGLGRVHPRCGLGEGEQPGLRCQSARELEAPLVAVGQRPGELLRAIGDAD